MDDLFVGIAIHIRGGTMLYNWKAYWFIAPLNFGPVMRLVSYTTNKIEQFELYKLSILPTLPTVIVQSKIKLSKHLEHACPVMWRKSPNVIYILLSNPTNPHRDRISCPYR